MKVAIGSTILAIVIAVVVAVAAWRSETDKARDNGEQLGQAVSHLYEADNSAEAEAAVDEIDAAIADTQADVSSELAEQVDDQADALYRAADGFVGSHTSDSDWDAELYQAELDVALDDLTDNASDFRAQGPEVHQAFWDGFESGINA